MPLHSLKYIATLQNEIGHCPGQSNPLFIYVDTKSGHGAGKPTSKVIQEVADMYAFIARCLNLSWLEWGSKPPLSSSPAGFFLLTVWFHPLLFALLFTEIFTFLAHSSTVSLFDVLLSSRNAKVISDDLNAITWATFMTDFISIYYVTAVYGRHWALVLRKYYNYWGHGVKCHNLSSTLLKLYLLMTERHDEFMDHTMYGNPSRSHFASESHENMFRSHFTSNTKINKWNLRVKKLKPVF